MPGAPLPALSTDAQAFVSDHDAYTFTTPGSGAPYRALIRSYPHIANAMDYATLHADLQDGIWNAINAAIQNGNEVADLNPPADFPASGATTYARYTRPEAIATHSAKVAHALTLEVTNAYPWRLASYTETQLRRLFDPAELYWSWTLAGPFPYAEHVRICDHSPKRVRDIVDPYVAGLSTDKWAVSGITAWMNRMQHGTQGQCRTVNECEAGLSAYGGCWPAVRLGAAAARSVNIPARDLDDRCVVRGSNHASLIVHSHESLTLVHGDDFYQAQSTAVPNFRRWMPYATWGPLIENESDPAVVEQESRRFEALVSWGWITDYYQSLFTYDGARPIPTGWNYLNGRDIRWSAGHWYYPFLSLAEETSVYNDLVARFGVTGLPPKPTTGTTGTTGGLTPTAGRTITASISNEDITGPIVVDANNVVITNCRIIASGGTAVTINSGRTGCEIVGCEITGSTVGINGAPLYIAFCYIHDNLGNALSVYGGTLGISIFYNLIAATLNAINVSGSASRAEIHWNVLSSTSSPVVNINSSIAAGLRIKRNWISGGTYAITQNTTAGELLMDRNRFGRTSTSGLYSKIAGPGDIWYDNRYENNEAVANQGDTAPL